MTTFPGRLENGFSAQLVRDGRPIAQVLDEGNRGPIIWRFLDPVNAASEQATLHAYAEGLPMEADEDSSFDDWCADAFALRLFDDHVRMARLHDVANRRMVILVPHIQRGHVPLILPFPYDPTIREVIRRKYGANTVFLNELPGMWWPTRGPSRRPAAGSSRDSHVLATTPHASPRSTPAGGPDQHTASVV